MKIFEIKSPTRVDLAGGTLDLWPLYLFAGGASTLNVAIDVWTYAKLEPLEGSQQIQIHSEDFRQTWTFASFTSFQESSVRELKLFQAALAACGPYPSGFRLWTKSESPVGGGLGGSSSLMISILQVLNQWMGKIPDSWSQQQVHQLVDLAHDVEAQVLGTPTGTQDYYPAILGGMNLIRYGAGSRKVQVQTFPSGLSDHFLLAYTGQSHHSGINNFEVMKRAVAGDLNTLQALRELRDISDGMIAEISKPQASVAEITRLFDLEYKARVQLEPSFGSAKIESIKSLAASAGAFSSKICGAGGGGCVLIWLPPDRKKEVSVACREKGFEVLPMKFVEALVPFE